MTQLRRRLWWQLIVLDGRFAPDIATDRFIFQTSFNTKKPLNINDSDINEHTKMINEREGLTEMTKCRLTHDIFEMAWHLRPDCVLGQGEGVSGMTTDEKMSMLAKLEQHVTEKVLRFCDPSNPMAWATSIIGQLTIRRARLTVYYPLHHDQHRDPPRVSKDHLLMTAVECMEYCNILDKDSIAARWKWAFKNAPVHWYGLAATLAQLCVQSRGPFVDRAWAIIDLVYEDWSARLAKSNDYKAWRPISKLRRKAQSQRTKALLEPMNTTLSTQAQYPSSQSETGFFNDIQIPYMVAGSQAAVSLPHGQTPRFDQTLASGTHQLPTIAGDPDAGFPSSDMDWAEWDQFAHDIRIEGS